MVIKMQALHSSETSVTIVNIRGDWNIYLHEIVFCMAYGIWSYSRLEQAQPRQAEFVR